MIRIGKKKLTPSVVVYSERQRQHKTGVNLEEGGMDYTMLFSQPRTVLHYLQNLTLQWKTLNVDFLDPLQFLLNPFLYGSLRLFPFLSSLVAALTGFLLLSSPFYPAVFWFFPFAINFGPERLGEGKREPEASTKPCCLLITLPNQAISLLPSVHCDPTVLHWKLFVH